MMQDKVLSMIGLARRAGCADSGDAAVRCAIDRRKARLIILAGDASERTKEVFRHLARESGTPLAVYGAVNDLGRALGKPLRAVVSINDEGFARSIIGILERGVTCEK